MATGQSVRKAVITAAGFGTRLLPATKSIRKELFPIVDRDGFVKPVIQVIIEEAIESGIEDVCLVVAPDGDKEFRNYFSETADDLQRAVAKKPGARAALASLEKIGSCISYVEQQTQEGYGDAVYCTKEWVGDEPVLIMLGDHLYISGEAHRCARQLMDVFDRYQAPVSAVLQRNESDLRLFGTVFGELIDSHPLTYSVMQIVEKPDVAYARAHLQIDDLPTGKFLCYFGLHVMTPDIFDCLAEMKEKDIRAQGEIQFTHSQAMLMQKRPYFACEINGMAYDMGVPEGFVETIQAFGKRGQGGSA